MVGSARAVDRPSIGLCSFELADKRRSRFSPGVIAPTSAENNSPTEENAISHVLAEIFWFFSRRSFLLETFFFLKRSFFLEAVPFLEAIFFSRSNHSGCRKPERVLSSVSATTDYVHLLSASCMKTISRAAEQSVCGRIAGIRPPLSSRPRIYKGPNARLVAETMGHAAIKVHP